MASVTVALTNPALGLVGDYNSNISVAVYQYVPNVCVNGMTSNIGTFLMKGPYTLSSTGTTTKTITLTDVFSTAAGQTSSGGCAGKLSFSNIHPYGTDYNPDTTSSWFNPTEWAVSYAGPGNMNMTGGAYQPITYLTVTNKQVDDVDVTDVNTIYLSQINPSCVTVTAA
jgi:hypothetical protein